MPGLPLPSRGGSKKVLPGFNLTLGYTLLYLSLIVLIPLSALVFRSLYGALSGRLVVRR